MTSSPYTWLTNRVFTRARGDETRGEQSSNAQRAGRERERERDEDEKAKVTWLN